MRLARVRHFKQNTCRSGLFGSRGRPNCSLRTQTLENVWNQENRSQPLSKPEFEAGHHTASSIHYRLADMAMDDKVKILPHKDDV